MPIFKLEAMYRQAMLELELAFSLDQLLAASQR
jgi:hypothetical protein